MPAQPAREVTMSFSMGLGWFALAVRLPSWLAERCPAPIACMGAGLTRHARAQARAAAVSAATELLG